VGERVLSAIVWWTGAAIYGAAGLAAVVWCYWQAIEFTCRHAGWTRDIIRASIFLTRERMAKKRGEKADG
jgi:hypothetical protein